MTECMQNVFAWAPGSTEWIVILIVALLLFGKRLPEVARGLGKSMNEFKKGLNEAQETKDNVADSLNKVKNDAINNVKNAIGPDNLNKN